MVRAVPFQTRTVSNNAPSAAQHQERVTDSAGPLGAAGTCTKGLGRGLHLPRATPRPPGRPRMRGGAHHTRAGAGTQPRVSPGVDRDVQEEVRRLRSQVDVLEQVRLEGRGLLSVGRLPDTDSPGAPGPGLHAGRGNGRGLGPHRRGPRAQPHPFRPENLNPGPALPAFVPGGPSA